MLVQYLSQADVKMSVLGRFPLMLVFFVLVASATLVSALLYPFKGGDQVFKTRRSFSAKEKYPGGDEIYISLGPRSLPALQDTEFPYKEIRLPKDIVPSNYKIWLKPVLKKKFPFNGRVTIDIKCVKATKNIILHSKKLDITRYTLADDAGNNVPLSRMVSNEKNEQILFEASSDLIEGKKYQLKLKFQGVLSSANAGFYKSSYKTKNGEVRWEDH